MKTKILLLSALIFTTSAQAANHIANDDYFSVGYVNLEDADTDYSGIGFSAAKINDGKEWGVVSSFDYVEADISGNKADYYGAYVGPIFRPESNNWIRVYPLAGLAWVYDDGKSRSRFSYGAGMQISLPDQPYYLEINYKKVKDFDTKALQVAIGYNF